MMIIAKRDVKRSKSKTENLMVYFPFGPGEKNGRWSKKLLD